MMAYYEVAGHVFSVTGDEALFALSTADKGTVLFHAAVVSHEGRGYMFLGPSGTGKSKHASLWLKYIDGTELVNAITPWCESPTMARLRFSAPHGAARRPATAM